MEDAIHKKIFKKNHFLVQENKFTEWFRRRTHMYLRKLKLRHNRRYSSKQFVTKLVKIAQDPTILAEAQARFNRASTQKRIHSLYAGPASRDWSKTRLAITRPIAPQTSTDPADRPPTTPTTSNQQNLLPTTNILCWNAGALNRHKAELIQHQSVDNRADLLLIQETWSRDPGVGGFTRITHTEPRESHSILRGGVYTAATPNLVHGEGGTFASSTRSVEFTQSHIRCGITTIAVINLYLGHSAEGYTDLTLTQCIENLTRNSTPIILMGDLNVDLNKRQWRRFMDDPDSTAIGKEALRARTIARLLHLGLIIRNPKSSNGTYTPTHHFQEGTEQSAIDWCLISPSINHMVTTSIIPMGLLGHHAIKAAITSTEQSRPNRRRISRTTIRSFIRTPKWDLHFTPNHPSHDNASNRILQCITSSSTQSHRDPLFSQWKSTLSKIRRIIERASTKKSPTRILRYLSRHYRLIDDLRITEAQMKERAQTRAQDFYTSIQADINAGRIEALRKFTFHNKINTTSKQLQTETITPTERQQHEELWNSLWNKEPQDPTTAWLEGDQPHPCPNPQKNVTHPITLEELKKAIQLMPNGRAPGLRFPVVEIYKVAPDFILLELLDTFNYALANRSYPTEWKNTSLILLNKQPPLNAPSNYRPINLTETPFRIFEKIMNGRLKDWADGRLRDNQFGFRKRRGTPELLLTLRTILDQTPGKLFITNLDLRKAYDSSPQGLTIQRMAEEGLDTQSCGVIKAILQGHLAVCGQPPNGFRIPIRSGVLQGSILAPLEFNLFVNHNSTDDEEGAAKIHGVPILDLSFADDKSLISRTRHHHQNSIDFTQHWATINHMQFNASKSISLIINGHNESPFLIDNIPIPIASEAKFVGITVSSAGTLTREASNQTMITAKNAWFKLRYIIQASTLIPIYYSFATAPFLYGTEVADMAPKKDTAANNFWRHALSLPNGTNNALLYEFTGTYRPTTLRMKRRLRFAIKCISSPAAPITAVIDNCANSAWWNEVTTDAQTLGISNTIQTLMTTRNTWRTQTHRSESPTLLIQQCIEANTILKRAIDRQEGNWFSEKLSNSTPFICRPGIGCQIFRRATIPGAQTIIRLHYDFNEHLRRHPSLSHLDHSCTLCHSPTKESNTHIIFECTGDRLSPEDIGKFIQAKNDIKSMFDPNHTTTHEYLSWLTADPRNPNGSRPSQDTINKIAQASKNIHFLRTRNFMHIRQLLNPSTITLKRFTGDQRISHCTALLQTTTQTEFQSHLMSMNRHLCSLKKPKWKDATQLSCANLGFHDNISLNAYYKLLSKINTYGPYLCTAGETRRQHYANSKGLWENNSPTNKSQLYDRIISVWRTAQKVPWIAELPIWHWIHPTPLAAAWTLEPRSIAGSLHHQIIGAITVGNIPKPKMKDIKRDLRAAFVQYANAPHSPMFKAGFLRTQWSDIDANARTRCVNAMLKTPNWQFTYDRITYTIHTQPNPLLIRHRTEIRRNVATQFTSDLSESTALAETWFKDMREAHRQ